MEEEDALRPANSNAEPGGLESVKDALEKVAEDAGEELSYDQQLEAAAREAKDTFGATLPTGYLSPEEYEIYERLYGPPIKETLPEDEELLEDLDEAESSEGQEHTLYREGEDGELEEVEIEESVAHDEADELSVENLGSLERLEGETEKDYAARMMLMRDIASATKHRSEEEYAAEGEKELPEYQGAKLNEAEQLHEESGTRSHPYTDIGVFTTSPTSVLLPKNTFTEPITGILSLASNRQLKEVAQKTFGGHILPDSVATPSSKGGHLQQKPIALEASQTRMGVMEANAFIAANMPGAFASVMATLVETRRRLGSDWIEGLLRKKEGPKVLDVGAAGAGVLAWHEVLRAEWARMHPEQSPDKPVPLGKATVVTGSPELRQRVSLLLEDTTFLPRVQDFIPTRDLPGAPSHNPDMRKQYDLIIAPHTLWTLKEDYMRKAQVQNYFTLLNPNGGVLIIIEKGVPRGFELVAGAREILLKYHIISPGSEEVNVELQDPRPGRRYRKEHGMIIAPCTNHSTCPMYTTSGQMIGRKDHCHFSQRFVRPQFLQRILGAKHSNHEDVKFSYLSVRRGVDVRLAKPTPQDEMSTLAALAGYEESHDEPNPFTLPRLLAPSIKRHKHVTFDLCTPAGNLERWTVPKSFSRQAYRDARKSRWGDLWALGAKTRVIRISRSGTVKPRPKQRVIEVGVGATEEEDVLRDLTEGFVGRKDRSGRKRTKAPHKLREKDLE